MMAGYSDERNSVGEWLVSFRLLDNLGIRFSKYGSIHGILLIIFGEENGLSIY
jgi:hypothetical protein